MKGDEAEGSIITFRRRGKAEKRPVALAEQPRMQTTNPERLIGRLLTHGAKLLIQLTKQSLFRPWQERQRREQASEGNQNHEPVASCDKSKTQSSRLCSPTGDSREIRVQTSREPEGQWRLKQKLLDALCGNDKSGENCASNPYAGNT